MSLNLIVTCNNLKTEWRVKGKNSLKLIKQLIYGTIYIHQIFCFLTKSILDLAISSSLNK